MWTCCCRLCHSSDNSQKPWSEMIEIKRQPKAEDRKPLEFCVPKTKRPSVSSQMGSDDGYDNYSSQRKASNCSVMSDTSSYGTQFIGDLASVLETLQEVESNHQDSLDSIPEEGTISQPEHETFSGNLVFKLSYDNQKNRFLVYVERAVDLPLRASKKPYDTFVKVSLLPSKTNRLSRTIKNSHNPHFHEEFIFQVQKKKQLTKRTLRLSLYDYERQGRHDAVGHVLFPLTENSLGPMKRFTQPLLATSLPVNSLGKLLMSLFYIPEKDRLTVTIYRGFNLRLDPASYGPLSLPFKSDSYQTYVKTTLMCNGEKVKTERSFTVAHSPTPVYNQSYHFVVPQSYLEDTSIVVAVLAKGPLKQDAVIGRIVSGPYVSTPKEDKKTHWGQMMLERKPALRWRALYL